MSGLWFSFVAMTDANYFEAKRRMATDETPFRPDSLTWALCGGTEAQCGHATPDDSARIASFPSAQID